MDKVENIYKVKLTHPNIRDERVIFDVTPDVSESTSVNYSTIDPVHTPGEIFVYRNTSARTFSISARLISRTREEATKNLIHLHYLRAWTKPRFGNSSTLSEEQRQHRRQRERGDFSAQNQNPEQTKQQLYGTELLGAPPQVLHFSAYSSTGTQSNGNNLFMEHIKRVPVVIQQLNIPYPSDVDYIPTTEATNNVPMPVIMSIDISLNEAHSPKEYSNFNLDKYKKGILPGF